MNFRVSISLDRYFNDERSYSYVHLDNKFDTIASFAKFIKSKFRIKKNYCLMIDNHLLPMDETVKIIQMGDQIKVVPIVKNWWEDEEAGTPELESNTNEAIDVVDAVVLEKSGKKKKKKKSKPEIAEHYNDEELPNEQHAVHSPTIESPKKKESSMDVSMINSPEQDNGDQDKGDEGAVDRNLQDNNLTNEPHANEMQSAIQQLKIKALTLLTEVASQKQVTGVSGGRINKRKRIRKRNKNSTLSVSTPDLSDSAASTPISFTPVMKSASHIRFENTDQQMAVSKTVRNSEIAIKPRIIHAVETNSSANSRRTSICSSGDNVVNNGQQEQIFTANNLTVPLRESKNDELSVESVKNKLNQFPVMDNVYPVEKDLVLFKMLKMGADYTPCISDYILGKVVEVEKGNGIVKMNILDGYEECRPVVGKFNLDSPSEEEENGHDLTVNVAWSQVNEARLIFP